MANRIVTATVTGETIRLSEKSAGAAGSFNAVSLSFTFDTAWDGTTSKVVQFLDAYGANPVNITLTSGMIVSGAYVVPIPAEPLVYAGEMTVTVRGVDFEVDGTTAERIIVCASTTMKVLSSLYTVGGATPVEPTPTQAEQLLTAVNSVTGMTVSATALPTGSPPTATKTTNVDGTININYGLVAGPTGLTGNIGATGATGATGAQGVQGIQGVQGYNVGSVYKKSGTGAAGTTDIYGMKLNDTPQTEVGTFNVYNGANGTGVGDMLASVYDPTSKNADAFARANHTGTQLKSTISDFSHTHGNITSDGKIGSTADLMVATTTDGALTTKTVADTKTLLGIPTSFTQIATGSYTGTDTYGASNPNSIALSFEPKTMQIGFKNSGNQYNFSDPAIVIILLSAIPNDNTYHDIIVSSSRTICVKKSTDGKTVSWYSTESALKQCNSSAVLGWYHSFIG